MSPNVNIIGMSQVPIFGAFIFPRKAPAQGQINPWLFLLVFLMLAINIRAGVYIAVATRFPDKYDVIIHCVSRTSASFIQRQIGFAFRGEVVVDADHA